MRLLRLCRVSPKVRPKVLEVRCMNEARSPHHAPARRARRGSHRSAPTTHLATGARSEPVFGLYRRRDGRVAAGQGFDGRVAHAHRRSATAFVTRFRGARGGRESPPTGSYACL
ncbi:hypothetical protein NL676_033193 [Syzygium grande]|nr:hypothetical protein NL676_033193 [Syzygium grande]